MTSRNDSYVSEIAELLVTQRSIGEMIDASMSAAVREGGWTATELGAALDLSKSEISRRVVRYRRQHETVDK